MNELSNHDHSRFLTRTNRKVGRMNTLGPDAAGEGVNRAVMREAVLIQMTWPGAPTIYYGDEAGLCGFTDPDNRRTYPWGREDQDLIAYHKAVIRMHKENEEFKTGSIKWMLSDYNMIGYARFTRDNHSAILINNNDHEVTKEVSVWELGIPRDAKMTRLMLTDRNGFFHGAGGVSAESGKGDRNPSARIRHRAPVPRSCPREARGMRTTAEKNFLQFT